jgi:hypothetical protein
MASHISHVLGFHRDVPLKPESAETRRRRVRIFWCIYAIERMLCLRLGRPPSIRDGDITVPIPRGEWDKTAGDLLPVLPKWIDIATIQGRVYDQIYSYGALLQSETVRAERARVLAADFYRIINSESPVEV